MSLLGLPGDPDGSPRLESANWSDFSFLMNMKKYLKAPSSFQLGNISVEIETLYDYCILHLKMEDGRQEDVVLPSVLGVRSVGLLNDGRIAICGDPWERLFIYKPIPK